LSTTNTIDALNQLLAILGRSFPQYLRYAHPYISPGHERTAEIFEEITSDQNELIERISQEIYDSGELPDLGRFPAEFTNCAESLHLAPAAKTLAEEAAGMTQGHLESLKEIADGV
jgi:hypothetical protein